MSTVFMNSVSIILLAIATIINSFSIKNLDNREPIENIQYVCYKPTFKDAEHTWHVIKCPFKGDK